MLSKRQIKIVNILCESKDVYLSAGKIAELCDVSARTIKSEIEAIKDYLIEYQGVKLISVPSKGYILIFDSDEVYKEFIRVHNNENIDLNFNDQSIRIKYILLLLLNDNGYIRRNKLLDAINISESTLYLDLKYIKKILLNYKLELIYESNNGYKIIGNEEDKRRCLIHENVYAISYSINSKLNIDYKQITKIKEILIETFLKYEYKISEKLLENLIMHVLLIIDRINKGYILDKRDIKEDINENIYNIAKEIMGRSFPNSKEDLTSEVNNLYIHLEGKCDFEDYEAISDDVNNFINRALKQINVEFGVDFTNDIDLKVVLALHFVPLISRIRNNMQLKNIMLDEIKRSFPFASDIAHYFGLLIFDEYQAKISEDEVAFLTLYFNYGLENNVINTEGKKILIISSLKKSETFLLRQRMLQWFKKQILEIYFVNPSELSKVDINHYDVLFTTDKNDTITKGAAVHISLFPNEKDFAKINLAINGYDSLESIISKFSKNLFYKGKAESRADIVKKLIEISNQEFDLPKKFEELVLERENLGSTYFANHIAMPHSLYPICNHTFVAIALLDEPLEWDDKQFVEMVMLVSTEMNNPKAFQLWPYLSSMVCDKEKVDRILKEKTYENFIEVMKLSLEDKF